MFSHRWIDLCQRHGLDVEVIECAWGSGAPADLFAQRLASDSANEIKAVLVTHNETATGVRSDIGAVRAALNANKHNALLLVDCVSSLASMDFRMDEWGVDVAVSGSQKGFMLATGMAILGVSEKALASINSATSARCFFDFRDMLKANKTGGYPYTPTLQLIQRSMPGDFHCVQPHLICTRIPSAQSMCRRVLIATFSPITRLMSTVYRLASGSVR